MVGHAHNEPMPKTTCTIPTTHCENCGSTDPEDIQTSDGYTVCCNELLGYPGSCRNHHAEDAS